jgi:ribonuclease HI
MGLKNTINIYTDGACKGNPGPGGWGAVLEVGNKCRCVGGREDLTTNNRMELRAALEALRQINGLDRDVRLTTDSRYLQRGITEWLPTWKAKGWKAAGKKPLKNVELWKALDELACKHSIEWLWVRGHSENPGNELADSLANQAIEQGEILETVRI